MGEAKGVASPGVKRECELQCDIRARRNNPVLLDDPDAHWPGFDSSELLDEDQIKLYQSVGALINFIAFDRPDLLFSTKEVLRYMSKPTACDMVRLKRIVRYIRTVPRWAAEFKWSHPSKSIEVFTDSDHAGCPLTRKSTLGGCILWGR